MREDWDYQKLGNVCQTGAGGTPLKRKKEFYKGGSIPWLLSGEVSQGEIKQSQNFITEEGLKKSSAKLFPRNTVLVAMYGATAGEAGILRFEASTNQAVCGIYPNKNLIPEFLYYCFLNKEKESVAQAAGNAQPNISQKKIKSTKIPIPPLPEQQRIVAILDEVFEAIDRAQANIEKNIESAEELFQSKLNEIFEQRGEGWEKNKLNEVCENLDRLREPISKMKREEGPYPYYGASGIVDYVADYIFDEDLLLVSEDGANLLARTYPIAFSIRGNNWVNNHAHVLRFKNIASQRFIEYYLNSIKLDPWVSGMAQPKLNQRNLNSIPVPFPTLEEQEKVVSELDNLKTHTEIILEVYKNKIYELAELKKSILQKAFSGELTAGVSRLSGLGDEQDVEELAM